MLRGMARPTIFTQEMADRFCDHIAEGKSMRSFVRENDDSPGLSSWTRWIVGKPEFWEQYTQARQAAGYAHADDMAEIVDKVGSGQLEPQAARVMMDGRKWTAERMAPKQHMPQSLINHESPQGTMTPRALDLSKLPSEALEAIVQATDDAKSND